MSSPRAQERSGWTDAAWSQSSAALALQSFLGPGTGAAKWLKELSSLFPHHLIMPESRQGWTPNSPAVS